MATGAMEEGHGFSVSPGIENADTSSFKIAPVPCRNFEVVTKGRRGDDQIRLRVGVPGSSSRLDQNPPPQHCVFGIR